MNLFERLVNEGVTCDICGSIMLAMYGGGWDHDRFVCGNRECEAEIELPTSTLVEDDSLTISDKFENAKSALKDIAEGRISKQDSMAYAIHTLKGLE